MTFWAVLWLVFSALLAAGYAVVTGRYRAAWRAAPGWRMPADWRPTTTVSVLIPARNEAKTIEACLHSIRAGDFPLELVEIIVIDDHSDDGTGALAAAVPGVHVLRLADHLSPGAVLNSYKKRALELGIGRATGELIVTTDADCTAGAEWLQLLVSAYERRGGTVALAAPVLFDRERSLFERFQSLDMLGLMGVTAAGLHRGTQHMANGANLAYARAAFYAVDGFAGNADRASGDDMFLVQKLARRYPGGIFFVKTPAAAVCTRAQPDVRAFLGQRLRWGSKNAALPEWRVRIALAVVFLFSWSLVVNAAATPFYRPAAVMLGGQLAVKAAVDYTFLRDVAVFFGRRALLRSFWPALILHVLYIVVVGSASLVVRRYGWKGRVVR